MENEQETKTCPYCAETIKAKAIVCRYCGRDLPPDSKSIPEPKKEKTGNKNIFKRASNIAIILTVLGAIGIFFRYRYSPTELMGSLIFGLIANYIVWTLILSVIFLLWEKLGAKLFIIVAVCLIGLSTTICVLVSMNSKPTPVPTPIPTPIPTSTKSPTKTPCSTLDFSGNTPTFLEGLFNPCVGAGNTPETPDTRLENCIEWDEVTNKYEGQYICVRGDVQSARDLGRTYEKGWDPSGMYTLIRFSNDPQTFYITSKYSGVGNIGDCIIVRGNLEYDPNGVPFIKIDEIFGKAQSCSK